MIEAAAGILARPDGQVLVAQRPAGGRDGGLWEFPGGKLEPGESPAAALARELDEELGIAIAGSEALHRVSLPTAEPPLVLHGLVVREWQGEPHGREGQALRWVAPTALDRLPMPVADRPLVAALGLPQQYAVSSAVPDEAAVLLGLARALSAGATLLQLRVPALEGERFAALARRALAAVRAHGARLLINGDPALATALAADGVHLSAARLRAASTRPLRRPALVLASCHDAAELARAAAIGCDAALLGPVRPTTSHPGACGLGWPRFAALAAACPLPVYAIGGVGPADLALARTHGAFGVAGISGWQRA